MGVQEEYHRERLRRELAAQQAREERAVTLGTGPTVPAAVQDLERRDVAELSVAEFRERYARAGQPVIITGTREGHVRGGGGGGEGRWHLPCYICLNRQQCH